MHTRTARWPSFGLDRFSGLYLGLLFIVIFGLWEPGLFFARATLDTVASAQAVSGMVALAVLVPLATGVYDLSVGANINLSALVVIVLMDNNHWSPWAAVGAAIAVSLVIGVVNGFIVVKLRVNSFIATLGTSSIILAVQGIVAPSQPSPPSSTGFADLSTWSFGGFQIVVVYLFVMALIVWWFLEHTPTGRFLYAVGGNSEAARLSGVNVGRLQWSSLIISGFITGIAAIFYASQFGPSLTFGPTLLLPAFAAAFLGSTQLKPGRVNVWGTIIAIYVLAIGVQGMQFVTSHEWISDMFNGVALVGAVAFATWRQRRRPRTGSTAERPAPSSPGQGGVVGSRIPAPASTGRAERLAAPQEPMA
jgi:ribose transport system permease protein